MRFVFSVVMALMAAPLGAAEPEDLFQMRDLVAPGECDDNSEAAIDSITLGEGKLYRLPCRNLVRARLQVMIYAENGVLRPVYFPQVSLDFTTKPNGKTDFGEARTRGVTASPLIVEASFLESATWVRSTQRVPPGLGEGVLEYFYWMNGSVADLTGITYQSDANDYGYPWPKRPLSASEKAMPEPEFNLIGFNQLDLPDLSGPNPRALLAQIEMTFPDLEEEGAPVLMTRMMHYERGIAADVMEVGWPDDSVTGQVFRVLMTQTDGIWRVTDLGQAAVCGRGNMTRTVGLCP